MVNAGFLAHQTASLVGRENDHLLARTLGWFHACISGLAVGWNILRLYRVQLRMWTETDTDTDTTRETFSTYK